MDNAKEWIDADGWILTHTGRQFWPLAPRAEDVDIEDIAHALSMTCRYNGHCSEFYSVAQHSVLVSLYCPDEHALWGLMHDASEAYLPDVPRPVKPNLPGFKDTENRVMKAVCERFGLSPDEPKEVKEIDNRILWDEMVRLMGVKDAERVAHLGKLGVEIVPWTPAYAKMFFLERFYFLTGKLTAPGHA